MTTVDPTAFKAAAGSFGTGVTVVTSNQDGQVYGMTVSAFASLSIEPMQIIQGVHDIELQHSVAALGKETQIHIHEPDTEILDQHRKSLANVVTADGGL